MSGKTSKLHYDGPVVLVVMDGVGMSLGRSGNAVRQAHTEFLDRAMLNYLNIPLQAAGEAVGVMPGQMGNSEVGHNAIGAGQAIKQGIASVEAAFATGDIWQSKAWRGAMEYLKKGATATSEAAPTKRFSAKAAAAAYWAKKAGRTLTAERAVDAERTLHFCGIFSDGGVHSDIKHLEQMIQRAYEEGVRRVRVHCVFDGRDVAPQSEPKYIQRLEEFFAQFPDADLRIASGGGRMVMTADRYESDWGMVKLGWDAMVYGKAPHEFTSAEAAVQSFRRENPRVQDQYLPAFVVVENGRPVGKIQDGDAVIYYDFRADRAVEIATAFTAKEFDKFDRSAKHRKTVEAAENPGPEVYFAGLMEYDADRHIPEHTLVPPVKITTPLNVFLGQNRVSQLAVAETVKFGHITYYFNGNSYKKAAGEKHIEIPSYKEPFNTRPWMKSAETTDAVLEELEKYRFVRINYPGGDMVGHFAELEPTIAAIEAIDIQLARLAAAVDRLGGMMIITADHGNAEELLDREGRPKTAHTVNPVPCIFYDNTANAKKYRNAGLAEPGLANLAATVATLLGLPDYPAFWKKPLIRVRL